MKLFDSIRGALKRPDASSSDIRAALAAIELQPLHAAVTAAERKRASLLLDGTEAQLDKADDELRLATRERDRAVAAEAELSRRLVEAEAAEKEAALDAERLAVAREASGVEKMLRERLPQLQSEFVALLERLNDAETAVAEVNARLLAAGRADTIPSVELRVIPVPEGQFAGAHSVLVRTELKEIPGAPAWPTPAFG